MSAMQQSLILSGAVSGPAAPLSPLYIGKGGFVASATTPSIPPPDAYADGDIFVLCVNSANQTIATPSGWTQVSNSPQSTGTAGNAGATRIAVFYKWVSGAQTNLTLADSGNYTAGNILGFRRVLQSPTSPIDVTAGDIKSSATGTTFTLPSVTTTLDNDLVLLVVGQDRDLASTTNLSSWTNSNLTDLVELADDTSDVNTGGGIGVAAGVKASAGSTGTTTTTSAAATTAAFLTVGISSTTTYLDTLRADLRLGSVEDVQYVSSTATATLTVETDGSMTLSGNNTTLHPMWLNKTSSGAGSSYWVRFFNSAAFGVGSWTGPTLETWHALSTARTWEVTSTADGITNSQYVLATIMQIATDSSGTNIIGRAIVSVVATSNIGAIP